MMAEEPIQRRLHVVRDEPPLQDDFRPIPSLADLGLVLAICVAFWGGLTVLLSTWL
jgi:hypothetical protein